jgi:hypothetical protein
MLPIRVIRVIRGQIRLVAAGARTVQPRSTRPIRERRRNCNNLGPQEDSMLRRRGPPVMNAGRRRIWWSSCPTSPHRANDPDQSAATGQPSHTAEPERGSIASAGSVVLFGYDAAAFG